MNKKQVLQLKLISGEELLVTKTEHESVFEDPLLVDRMPVEDENNMGMPVMASFYMLRSWYLNQYEENDFVHCSIDKNNIIAVIVASEGVTSQYTEMLKFIKAQQKNASQSQKQQFDLGDFESDDSSNDNIIKPNFTGPRSIN